jgi:hypothetical protein
MFLTEKSPLEYTLLHFKAAQCFTFLAFSVLQEVYTPKFCRHFLLPPVTLHVKWVRIDKHLHMNTFIIISQTFTYPRTRVYPKVSGLAALSDNCKWYSSLSLDAVVSLFCESV